MTTTYTTLGAATFAATLSIINTITIWRHTKPPQTTPWERQCQPTHPHD